MLSRTSLYVVQYQYNVGSDQWDRSQGSFLDFNIKVYIHYPTAQTGGRGYQRPLFGDLGLQRTSDHELGVLVLEYAHISGEGVGNMGMAHTPRRKAC